MTSRIFISTGVLLLGACAATAPPTETKGARDAGDVDLACPLPSNCVSSRDKGGLGPLSYTGTPAQALVQLQATVKTFPEASIVRSEPLALEVIFTTAVGFKDQVDFRIDPQAQRIEFRSRSLLGLFDWGKNRSRMVDVKARFEQQARP